MKTTVQLFYPTTRLFLLLAVLILGGRLWADDTNQWKFQVTGLRVVAPPAESGDNARGAFFSSPGVALVVTLTPAAGKIVSLDQFESKVDSFTDDKGTDLLAVKSEDPFNKPGIGTMENKESYATFEIQAAGVPAKGATELKVAGKVVVKTAAATKQFTVENVAITNHTSFTCGDLPITITAAGLGKAMFSSDKEFSVNFSSTKDLESIAKLEFLDAQGNKVEAHKTSWGGGMGAYFVEFTLKRSVDHARIVATCWEDMKTVEVPISLQTGVGL